MSRRIQDARTASAAWRAWVRGIFAAILPGAMRVAVRRAVVGVLEEELGRPLTESELALVDSAEPRQPARTGPGKLYAAVDGKFQLIGSVKSVELFR